VLVALASLIFTAPAIAEDEVKQPEGPAWTGKVALGGSLSLGTNDSLKGVLEAGAERVFDPHLLRFGLYAAYGSTKNKGESRETDNNKQEVTEYYRYTFSERFFVYGDSLQGRDLVQNIKFRFLASAGPGWRAWYAGDKDFLDLELGIGYRNESRRGDDDRSDVTGRVGATFAKLLGPAEFRQTAEYLLPFNQTGAWLATGKASLSFPLTEAWSFENSLLLEYNNKPPDSTKNEKLDYIISLVYSF
jgi:putative salt-induced outer membrane protein YdiY